MAARIAVDVQPGDVGLQNASVALVEWHRDRQMEAGIRKLLVTKRLEFDADERNRPRWFVLSAFILQKLHYQIARARQTLQTFFGRL